MAVFRRLKFSLWYFRHPPWDTGVTPPELYRFIQENEPGRALDLGCGTGTNAVTLAQHGWSVTGIDFAPRAIRAAKSKAKKLNLSVNFMVGDVTRAVQSLAPFDLVLDIGCLHSLPGPDRNRYFENLATLVAHGGAFLLYTNIKKGGDDSSIGIHFEELSRLLGPFRLISREDGLNLETTPSAWLEFRRL